MNFLFAGITADERPLHGRVDSVPEEPELGLKAGAIGALKGGEGIAENAEQGIQVEEPGAMRQ